MNNQDTQNTKLENTTEELEEQLWETTYAKKQFDQLTKIFRAWPNGGE